MKKSLPTVLPLLSTALIALVPDFQHYLITFVTAHPAWSSFATAAALILNHWLPAPNATPSDSTIAKAGTSLLLCFALIANTTGCNYNQAEVVKGVQRVETGLKIAKGIIPQAQLIVNQLQQVDADASAAFAPFVAIAEPQLVKAIAACETYIANPGNDAYQAILNAVDAFTAQVDQQALTLSGIKNQQSQAKVVGWIAVFATGLHVTLGIAEAYATSKQKKAVPVLTARVPFDQIRPFLKRDYARAQLTAMGYHNPDQLLSNAGL